jgi:hypothetical protein
MFHSYDQTVGKMGHPDLWLVLDVGHPAELEAITYAGRPASDFTAPRATYRLMRHLSVQLATEPGRYLGL